MTVKSAGFPDYDLRQFAQPGAAIDDTSGARAKAFGALHVTL